MNKSPGGHESHRPKHNGPKHIKNTLVSFWGIWVILAVIFVSFAMNIADMKPHTGEEAHAVEAAGPPGLW